MKLFWWIISMLALCSIVIGGLIGLGLYLDYEAEQKKAVWEPYGTIITNEEAKKVMNYHGILSMKWSIPHKDFVFERDGEICRARAFEIIKEKM